MEYLELPIIWGCEFDLRLVDTSFTSIKIVKVGDTDFVDFLSQFYAKEFVESPWFKENTLYSKSSFDNLYKDKFSFIPTTSDYTCFEKDYIKIFSLFQVVFPSDLQIERILHIDLKNPNSGPSHSEYLIQRNFLFDTDGGKFGYSMGKIINPKIVQINDLNVFVRQGYNNFALHEFSIDNFIHSYTQSVFFQYVALCMTIESTINSKTEVAYKFSRNTAIMCGIEKEDCGPLFLFLKQAYSLRSDILHGNALNLKLVALNLTTLRSIVSILLINLLSNGISREEFNKKIHSLGFGQKASLVPDFIELMPNLETLVNISSVVFKK